MVLATVLVDCRGRKNPGRPLFIGSRLACHKTEQTQGDSQERDQRADAVGQRVPARLVGHHPRQTCGEHDAPEDQPAHEPFRRASIRRAETAGVTPVILGVHRFSLFVWPLRR
nr:MAG TPA: hypothetical protein [Caudoviricetes sp.]